MSYLLALAFVIFVVAGSAVTFFLPAPGVLDDDISSDEADERLITNDDIGAVRAAFDRMTVGKGLVTALIPVSAMAKVTPGSMIDTYYRSGNQSAVAICVPPR